VDVEELGFRALFLEAVGGLRVSAEDLVVCFDVPRVVADGWVVGHGRPHPVLRGRVLGWFAEQGGMFAEYLGLEQELGSQLDAGRRAEVVQRMRWLWWRLLPGQRRVCGVGFGAAGA
jgi:hypothetical protein